MNKLLQRQLQKYLGPDDTVPEKYLALFDAISDSYDHFEKDRRMLERSIDLSSNEMIDLNKKLSQDLKEKEMTEKELRSTNLRLTYHLNNTPLAVVEWDRNQNIIYWGKSAEEMFGWKEEEVLGRNIHTLDIVHEEDMALVEEVSRNLMSGSVNSNHNENRNYTKGKDILTCEWYNSVLKDEQDNITILSLVKDKTKEKKAEKLLLKSEANLRAIFDNTDIAYVFLDRASDIVSYNHTAAQAFKKELNFELAEGQNLIESIPCDWKRLALRRHQAVLRGEKVTYELSFGKTGDTVVWYQVNMLPVYSDPGRILGLIVACEDITDRKTAELEREKMTIDLSQRNKDLEQFAYIVSHNLRSPVANILGLSHLFLSASVKEPKDQKILMEGVASSVKKLDEVIIDLNSILQIRREINEKKEVVCFSDLVDDIKLSIQSLMEKENVIIRTDFVEVDNFFTLKSYLNSIFFNLISNSIKYRSKDFAPVIRIESRKVKDKVFIKFSDNGLGIDLQNNGNKIFGLYKKFHNHVDGKGMGLYMVKTQTEILGGKISVASEVNKGTEFMLEFDLQVI
jgi:PAS domain S-box-containing protein